MKTTHNIIVTIIMVSILIITFLISNIKPTSVITQTEENYNSSISMVYNGGDALCLGGYNYMITEEELKW